MILEISAQKLLKRLPFTTNLIISKPPKKVIKPIKATICMKTFLLDGNFIDNIENKKIINPI